MDSSSLISSESDTGDIDSMVKFAMNKKYQKILKQEESELEAVRHEFCKLERAWWAYERAMEARIESAKHNGTEVRDHSVNCTNSHQAEVDALRKASLVFGEKIGGRGFNKALKIFHKMHDEIFDALEMDSGTIL